MNAIGQWLVRFAAAVSHLLEPVVFMLERLQVELRQGLDRLYVPYEWRQPIITASWVLVLYMLVRTLQGWARAVALVLILLVLAKLYEFMPAPMAPKRP